MVSHRQDGAAVWVHWTLGGASSSTSCHGVLTPPDTRSCFLPHSPGESTETGEDSRGSNMVLNPLGGPLSDCSRGGGRDMELPPVAGSMRPWTCSVASVATVG